MNGKIIRTSEQKIFEPVTIEMTFEAIEELRLMFHVLNRQELKQSIFSNGYGTSVYDKNIDNNFYRGEAFRLMKEIKEEIERQGFKL